MKSEEEIKRKITVIQRQIDELHEYKEDMINKYSGLTSDDSFDVNLDISTLSNNIKMLEWVLSPSTSQKEIQKNEAHNSYQDFFDFLSQEHHLTCTIQEMQEIKSEAIKLEEKLLQEKGLIDVKRWTMKDFMSFYMNGKYDFTADPQAVLRDMLNQKK